MANFMEVWLSDQVHSLTFYFIFSSYIFVLWRKKRLKLPNLRKGIFKVHSPVFQDSLVRNNGNDKTLSNKKKKYYQQEVYNLLSDLF